MFWAVTGGLIDLAFLTRSQKILAEALTGFSLLLVFDRSRAAWWVLALALVLGALLAWIAFDSQVVAARLSSGMYDAVRMDQIWLPSIEIWLREAPWLGFGYGPSNFDAPFREALSQNPGLVAHGQGGSLHNQWLLLAVQTGLLGITISALLWAALLWLQFKTALRTKQVGALGGFAVLAALLGHYGVRGMIDTLNWVPLGVLMGMAAAVGYGHRPVRRLGWSAAESQHRSREP